MHNLFRGHTMVQFDLEGSVLFLHRNLDKWSVCMPYIQTNDEARCAVVVYSGCAFTRHVAHVMCWCGHRPMVCAIGSQFTLEQICLSCYDMQYLANQPCVVYLKDIYSVQCSMFFAFVQLLVRWHGGWA